MLSSLALQPEVEQYLKSFPRAQWEKCAGLTMRLGIRTAKSLYPYGVTIDGLTKALASSSDSPDTQDIKDKLNRLKATLEARRGQLDPPAKSHPSKPQVKLSSPPPFREKPLQLRIPSGDRNYSPLLQPPFRLTSRGSVETQLVDTKQGVPKHLKVVESKIKADVKRDIERYKSGEGLESSGKRAEPGKGRGDGDAVRPSPRPSHVGKKDNREVLDFGVTGGALEEPKTNLAIVEKLAGKANSPRLESKRPSTRPSKDSSSSVLRIADDFLSDPLMATLSAHASPKFSPGPSWLR